MIPKTEKVERTSENIDIFDIELSKDELHQIRGLDQNIRAVSPD